MLGFINFDGLEVSWLVFWLVGRFGWVGHVVGLEIWLGWDRNLLDKAGLVIWLGQRFGLVGDMAVLDASRGWRFSWAGLVERFWFICLG